MNDTPHDVPHADEPAVPDRLYCGDCVYCQPGPNTKNDVFARNCYRFPPTAIAVVMTQGIAVVSARPEIRPDTWACGEYETEEDDDPSIPTGDGGVA